MPVYLLLYLVSGQVFARDDGTCNAWLAPSQMGAIQDDELSEISGLVVSRANPDVLWLHNDRGGKSTIYAVWPDGSSLASYGVLGATNEDWEDIALGPCAVPAQSPCSCLYIADIGDNDLSRDLQVIYRITEPAPQVGGSQGQTDLAQEIWFSYPDGPHDAEALLVHPETGETLVVTKEQDGTAVVFGFPDAPPQQNDSANPYTLDELLWLDLAEWDLLTAKVTAADLSPSAQRLVLRTDSDLVLMTVPDGGGLLDAMLGDPLLLPVPESGDGEALGFSVDGRSIYLVGEGEQSTLWQVDCASFVSDGEDPWDPLVDCDDQGTSCGCGAAKDPESSSILGLVPLVLLLGRRRRGGRPALGVPTREPACSTGF